MAQAFQCDMCGKVIVGAATSSIFSDGAKLMYGKPHSFRLSVYWDTDNTRTPELCRQCFIDLVRELAENAETSEKP